ncbi:expressed unknown protein [Seminavis robusta]|uniref:Uncharacterized protein n=1 Tax=Seminavis robusta TaxID=568900 RepID=A0A9N8ETR4_9STRA|nr:expressed unknown protein [Seminavis robusta]|eukprot:Sro1739_g294580.1 n/a (1312) ;mRNA; f:13529-17464
MKFLFRSSNKHSKTATPPVASTVPTHSQHLRAENEQPQPQQPQQQQHQHDDMALCESSTPHVKKPKHRKGRQKQQKRRQSLEAMDVPLRQSRAALSNSLMSTSTASTVRTGFTTSNNNAGNSNTNDSNNNNKTSRHKKPVSITLSNSSNQSRVTNGTEATTSTMSTRSDSITTNRTSTSTTVHSSITTRGSMWSGGSPSFAGSVTTGNSTGGYHGRTIQMIKSQQWGSHRSLDDDDDHHTGSDHALQEEEEEAFFERTSARSVAASLGKATQGSQELQAVDEHQSFHQLEFDQQSSSSSSSSSSSTPEEQSAQSSSRDRDTVTVGTAVSAISGISSLYEISSSHDPLLDGTPHPEADHDHVLLPPPSSALHQMSASPAPPTTTTTLPQSSSSAALRQQHQPFPTNNYLDTSITDPKKDHAFQLVPNIHKELGMVHRDFNSIKEATTHFLTQDKRLKPILSLDIELPGNLHAGRTIFAHPLIVEAIETYFAVVTNTFDTLPQEFHANVKGDRHDDHHDVSESTSTSCSKMRGNYLYTRIRILDPLTGCDLVPCVDDRHLSRAALLQAMMDALAMVCPDQPLPRYLTNLLEEEQATIHAAALFHRRQDLNYYYGATTTTIIAEQELAHHHHTLSQEEPKAPMAVFGLEHTALGEVVFAELEGVLSTQCGWVIPQLSSSCKAAPASAAATSETTASTDKDKKDHPPDRQAVILVSYDPHRLSYCTLAKFAVQQHALQRLGRPSCLTFYYTSHEQQVAAQMHTRAHYRQLIAQVDPNNPAQHYYNTSCNSSTTSGCGSSTTSSACPPSHETIRIVPLQQRDHKGEPLHDNNNDNSRRRNGGKMGISGNGSRSSASSTGSSSEESLTAIIPRDNRKNNSKNKTHPGYKVPNYDGVVAHAAAKAAAEAAAGKGTVQRYSFVLKTMCGESLQLQCSKPALRESHLRFVPLTPFQATRANQLVCQGKFHLAMKLLSPRQGMVLMHALRSGKPRRCLACSSNPRTSTTATASTATGKKQAPPAAASPKKANNKTTPPDKKPLPTTKPKQPSPTKPANTTKASTKSPATTSNASPKKGKAASPGAKSGTARRVSTTSIESGASSSKPLKATNNGGKKATPKRRSSAKPTTATPNNKAVPSNSKSTPPNTRQLRRVATTDGLSPIRKFPRQAPRMSLNTEALQASIGAAAASLQQEEEAAARRRSSRRSSRRASSRRSSNSIVSIGEPSPPVATIDTSKSSSTSSYHAAAEFHSKTDDILYKDVVDVPILEAWKAFVVFPEGWPADGEDDDDSYLWGMNDVYSQDGDDRVYYTSDDTYSIGS